REDVEFELADTRRARPADRDIEERRPHALAPMTGGDHETQVGHVSTRRVWISGQEEPADDALTVVAHEHSGVGVALDASEVAALVRRGPPRPTAEDPASFLS